MKILELFTLIAGLINIYALNEDEFVAEINRKANGMWVAKKRGSNFKPFYGAILSEDSLKDLKVKTYVDERIEIPQEFDARKKWPHCKSISQISDQGPCGSCWAMGAADSMSDRMCIHKNVQVLVSPFNLMTCCDTCAPFGGCNGGYPSMAWNYWKEVGIVSGGLCGDNSTCQPYTLKPNNHQTDGKYPRENIETPPCTHECVNKVDYEGDKSYGVEPYRISANVEAIQQEIMTNGPVEVTFQVYNDFPDYHQGIYRHKEGTVPVAGHAVRMIGWGEENGTPYWLLANSWNKGWGEKGLVRFLRGSNECGIESGVIAGLPR